MPPEAVDNHRPEKIVCGKTVRAYRMGFEGVG